MSCLSVLWIDDDPRDNYSRWIKKIEKQGHKVTWADSINNGIQQLTEHAFDCVIVDQMMPFQNSPGNTSGGTEWGGCMLIHWLKGQQQRWQEHCDCASGLGWDFLPEDLQQQRPKAVPARIIVSSGFDHSDIKREILAAAPEVVFISKPPTTRVLLAELEELVEVG